MFQESIPPCKKAFHVDLISRNCRVTIRKRGRRPLPKETIASKRNKQILLRNVASAPDTVLRLLNYDY